MNMGKRKRQEVESIELGQLVKDTAWEEKTTGITSLLPALITGCVEVSFTNMREIIGKIGIDLWSRREKLQDH